MRKFLSGTWRVITYPFRFIYNIIAFPFRKISQFNKFLNTEPEDHPVTEIFLELTTNEEMRQMMWDQVEALRMHLLRSVIVLSVVVLISFGFSKNLSSLLAEPIRGVKLETIEVTEGFGVFMKIALVAGIAFASPYLFFEAWLFAAPGLKPKEKKYGFLGIPFATMLFISGVAFTYFILPSAFIAIRQFNDYMGFVTKWTPNSYYGFVTNLMLWMGIFFEFPLVIYVLSSIGLVNPKLLAEQWRLATIIIAIIAAAITPTVDPVNMGLVMIPMILLYFISVGLSHIAYAGRKRNQAEEQKKADEAEAN